MGLRLGLFVLRITGSTLELEGTAGTSAFQKPQRTTNPAPTDSNSTRSERLSGSCYICTEQSWGRKHTAYSAPLPPERALNSAAEFQVAPWEQTLHPVEFKASKFSLQIQQSHPPGAAFPSERHDWNLNSFAGMNMLQHALPAYRITARTWLVVKYTAWTVMKTTRQVFIS